jgi:hypothetical protein
MFREKYKADNELINPNPELLNELLGKMEKETHTQIKTNRCIGVYKFGAIATAFALLFIGASGIFSYHKKMEIQNWEKKYMVTSKDGVNIPEIKISLPKPQKAETTGDVVTSTMADMVGLIVYKGKIYTESVNNSLVSLEDARLLQGEMLGTTKDLIEEGNVYEQSQIEFASNLGVRNVYSVKGYDLGFRIMTYIGEEARFYERLNGINIKTGEDIFGKLKLKGNIESVVWQSHESWNWSKKQYKPVNNNDLLWRFIANLYVAAPYSYETFKAIDIYNNKDIEQRFMELKLKDGCQVQIKLFGNGYVVYNGYVFFKVEKNIFEEMWESLK